RPRTHRHCPRRQPPHQERGRIRDPQIPRQGRHQMIPQRLTDKAIYYASENANLDRFNTDSLAYAEHLVEAALHAVAADIWDEGYTRGVNTYDVDASLHDTREIDLNPYRASENE